MPPRKNAWLEDLFVTSNPGTFSVNCPSLLYPVNPIYNLDLGICAHK